jgi:hypothetical protein
MVSTQHDPEPATARRVAYRVCRAAGGDAAPGAATRSPHGHALRELAYVGGATAAHFLTRGLARGYEGEALRNAGHLIDLERATHLAIEPVWQATTLPHGWLIGLMNAIYLVGHLPFLIGVALWLFRCRPAAYPWLRNAFPLSAISGRVAYTLLPMAPPRRLPGFAETLAAAGHGLDGSAAGALYNPDAAMPSLHAGWSLFAGAAIALCAGSASPPPRRHRDRAQRAIAVIVTGNRYLLDAVAGAAVTLVALGPARWWAIRTATASARPTSNSRPALAVSRWAR